MNLLVLTSKKCRLSFPQHEQTSERKGANCNWHNFQLVYAHSDNVIDYLKNEKEKKHLREPSRYAGRVGVLLLQAVFTVLFFTPSFRPAFSGKQRQHQAWKRRKRGAFITAIPGEKGGRLLRKERKGRIFSPPTVMLLLLPIGVVCSALAVAWSKRAGERGSNIWSESGAPKRRFPKLLLRPWNSIFSLRMCGK